MIEGYGEFPFEFEGATRTVFKRGSGPAVIVMSEIPGITPQVIRFANYVAAEGMTVYMPHLFGEPGRAMSTGYMLKEITRACISKEFQVWKTGASSPIVSWCRALSRQAFAECGGKGVGAVGMCLTGNFALSMMVEPFLMAPVLSQPSLPFSLGAKTKADMKASPEEVAAAKERIAQGAKIMGLRFFGDPMCPGQRFQTLRKTFGDDFIPIEIEAQHANPDAPRPAHSVLTTHLIDEAGQPTRDALDQVLAFLRKQLIAA